MATQSRKDTVLQDRDRTVIRSSEISTPLGTMLAGATDNGICLLEFVDNDRIEKQVRRLQKLFRAEIITGGNPHLNALSIQLEEYFAGSRKEFDLIVVALGTPFQQAVWKELITIPYGETISYQEEAVRIGRPTAVRAVARANGDNPISIVIPCHRVIGKNGKLVGYGGGLWRKERLLALEKEHPG
ncbi:MAG: methylated-DNA--[protein]-cysteine S-methyltransferase [Candidatus Bipolaricaulota bacterium]|nr:methylated-DNA--[protein]-cysteine S-methyltransferase [Candidatus Bipolaricaulota bacterium]